MTHGTGAASASVPIVSPDDQKVTFVELFFDLVFVFCVTQVVHLMHGHVDLKSAGSALLVFWLVWWAWTQFTWALNAANTEHPRVQVVTMLATAIAFFLGVGIPHALDEQSLWFAGPYVAVRSVGLLLYYWVAWSDPEQRSAVRIFALFSLSGLVMVLVGALLGGAALYWCWAATVMLDLVSAAVGGQREGWNLHPEHFTERHGLIVIIALGETLIVAAAGLAEAPRTPTVILTGATAVMMICALWWTYFPYVKPACEHAIASRKGSARSAMARDVFSVIHFPMLCGVVGIAVAIEVGLARPSDPLETSVRAALGVGTLLFIGGTAAALWRASGRVLASRVALASLGAVVAVAVAAAPWVSMMLTFLILTAVVLVERTQFS